MKTVFRKYTPDDFIKVRDFIINTYQKLGKPNNWLIDRWEFVEYVQEPLHNRLSHWHDIIGIWENESTEIKAVALVDWNAFFLLDTFEPTDQLMNELFDFAEERLLVLENGQYKNKLAITEGMKVMEELAKSRGYYKSDDKETIIYIDIDKHFDVSIPSGFNLCSGSQIDDTVKALGHIFAFDYPGTDFAEMALKHYGNMKNTPDYNPELDLFINNEKGEVVSFCNIWFDKANKIGIFEPVGTHRDYRFLGLGKAVMYEGLNRLGKLGATKTFVGGDKEFYRKIGFKSEITLNMWKKKIYVTY